MSSRYEVELIFIEKRNKLLDKYGGRSLHGRADIYGWCIKLLTDVEYVKERWEESFNPMSAHVRSHRRLKVTNDENEGQEVLYDPLSKTAFLINIDYYG